MKLTVFGATGGTGEQIVRHGLAAGHEVTAVVRNPDAMRVADPRLRVVIGDVLQPASVLPAVAGAGAVLSALGSRTMRRPTSVYPAGTAAVLGAMREAGVRRFDRDWTVFWPPRLTDAAAAGRYRLAVDAPLPRAWTIPRADLAAAMVAAVPDSTMVGHAVSIAA